MNWYKRIYSAYERRFTARELIPRFEAYGVVFVGSTSGSRHTLMNKNNGQYTNFHYHKLGEIVEIGKLKDMLRGLGIDYKEFVKNKKPMEQQIEEPSEQKNKSWKKNRWYQNYLKNTEINNFPKMEPKNELA